MDMRTQLCVMGSHNLCGMPNECQCSCHQAAALQPSPASPVRGEDVPELYPLSETTIGRLQLLVAKQAAELDRLPGILG